MVAAGTVWVGVGASVVGSGCMGFGVVGTGCEIGMFVTGVGATGVRPASRGTGVGVAWAALGWPIGAAGGDAGSSERGTADWRIGRTFGCVAAGIVAGVACGTIGFRTGVGGLSMCGVAWVPSNGACETV